MNDMLLQLKYVSFINVINISEVSGRTRTRDVTFEKKQQKNKHRKEAMIAHYETATTQRI